MARYNVQVTTADGLTQNVVVEADTLAAARSAALSQSEYGSRAGTPVLTGSGVANEDSFSSFVGGIDSNYNPSAYGIQNPLQPVSSLGYPIGTPYDPTGGASAFPQYRSMYGEQYDPLGGAGYAAPPAIPNPISADLANQLAYANSQGNQGFGIDPVYGETYDPVSADLRNQLDYANSQANAVPDFMTGAELDAAEAAQFALDQRKRDDDLREKAKQASLVSGPVRSWDSKLADITVNADGTVNLPTDMWRNSSTAPSVRGGSAGKTASQNIGREQLEDAIRKIAELGGRKDLNANVERLLRDARAYYSNTPRGDNTWDKNIDSGLIDGKLIYDAGFKATWGSLADEILGARKADVEDQIPKDIGGSGVTNPWADTNPDGFLSLSAAQQKYVIDNNLKGMKELRILQPNKQAKFQL
jgi:hypothetical protein